MPDQITPVLLAGGTGTRLWPISRDALPKQFLPLVGSHSTYQRALLCVANAGLFAPPIVMTGPDFQFFAERQAEEAGVRVTIAVEPVRRDSGPALAAAALIAHERDPSAIVLALAVDNVIFDVAAFHAGCMVALEAARSGHVVTFGVKPTQPRTSYGYILPGDPIGREGVFAVKHFIEKPDAATAVRCVEEGYLWNSGNVFFRADALLEELERFEPAIVTATRAAVKNAIGDPSSLSLDPVAFASAPQKSIDYAMMEKTDRAAVVVGQFRWSDIGSWDALFDVASRNIRDNVIHGTAVTTDAEGCVIHSEDMLTAVVGVKDLVVASTRDAVMVIPRARSQEIRELVDKLRTDGRLTASIHQRVHQPWGYLESISAGERFRIGRIVVSPGRTFSTQNHHRAGHWVVIHGAAEVTFGETTHVVRENESIPFSAVHELANRGDIPLELIEIQVGHHSG